MALREPASVVRAPLHHWDELVRQARRANLLGRLATELERRELLSSVPEAPRTHLQSALVQASAQERAARSELRELELALEHVACPVVLLKGAAYLAAGHPARKGRMFSDIDILVPRDAMADVESALMLAGWMSTHHHPYDQRYYRRWMHELPPMRHVKRLSVIDVHHAILPITSRLRPDSAKLLGASRSLPGTRFRVLSAADMILHSATHLFHNEELDQGLRDLCDLDVLLRTFTAEERTCADLVARARELELVLPLSYALPYVCHFFDTRIPDDVRATVASVRSGPVARMMDALFIAALRPDGFETRRAMATFARKCLYVRAHWLKMPPWLLVYHLSVKMLRSEEPVPA